MKKQIGILGGTFDPVHNGHLLAAETAREQAGLDEVWFMPAGTPPHKRDDCITPARHRLRMVELAIADHPAFRVTDVELRRNEPSYTVHTMRELVNQHPDAAFSFILGGDMLATLPKWHRFDELARMVRFIGLARPGSAYDAASLPASVTLVEMPAWDISSTLIRERARAGKSLRYLVPPAVERYIKEHGLYGDDH